MLQQSRRPPPRVAPVSHDGVRYEQVRNARSLGYEEASGYLAAIQESTGERLWVLQVYPNEISPELERDVQERYFQSMELLASKRELHITNEAGKRFVVDIDRHSVRAAE